MTVQARKGGRGAEGRIGSLRQTPCAARPVWLPCFRAEVEALDPLGELKEEHNRSCCTITSRHYELALWLVSVQKHNQPSQTAEL